MTERAAKAHLRLCLRRAGMGVARGHYSVSVLCSHAIRLARRGVGGVAHSGECRPEQVGQLRLGNRISRPSGSPGRS